MYTKTLNQILKTNEVYLILKGDRKTGKSKRQDKQQPARYNFKPNYINDYVKNK
jgi:hypothetical protein